MTGRWGRGRTDRHSTAQHGRPGGRHGRDGGASQIVVIGIIGAAALLLMGFLTIPMIVGGSSLLFSAGTGGFGCSGSAQQAKTALQSKVSGQAKNSIPSNYLTWYQKVGQQYGVPWVILAGIGTVESDNGRTSLSGVHSGSNAFGAAGPMQIGIGGAAGNSWGGAPAHPASEVVDGVATDEDGDGTASVYDPADAIAGAAKYLLAHGVLANAAAAIFAYNHLASYVQAVQNYAGSYASGGFSVAPSVGSPAASTAACVQLAGTVISGSSTVPNQVVSAAIAFAQHQIGKPYLWGGTGPDAFDCSGLVMMAYQAAGVDIPRTSEDQWAWGPKVPASQAEPGDLVFFAGSDGTATNPGHVGMVIGGGKMIEAYATGFPIRISTYGTASSAGGLSQVVGFTRPWAHAGVTLPAGATSPATAIPSAVATSSATAAPSATATP
jgi:peptidoglycan DL-endopeptidase CwlO